MTKDKSQEMPSATPVAPDGPGTLNAPWLSSGDDAAAWHKARKLAQDRLDTMLSLAPKILRTDDSRHIHQFRVASRRLQQVLDLLSVAPMPASVKRLRRKVRRCRRIFSDVRNCDVLIQRVEGRLARRRAGHREAWNAVLDYLHERRSHAHARALRKLAKLNFGRVYIRLRSALASGEETAAANGEGDLPAARSSGGQLRGRLIEELEKAWRGFQETLIQSQQSPGGESIHRARIAAKRLRYLVEAMRAVEIPGCGEVIGWLRELQQYLGDWHDLEVGEQMLAEMLARPQFLRDQLEIAAEIVKLIVQQRKVKLQLSGAYQKMGLTSEGGARLQTWVEALLTRAQHEG